MNIAFGARTDPGKKRTNNEDNFCAEEDLGLFLVVDGIGGHFAGEVASQIAADTVKENLEKAITGKKLKILGGYNTKLSKTANQLVGSIRLANTMIYEASKKKEKYWGMGTTLVAVLFLKEKVITANVGDSRIYLIRDHTIRQLTEDHSLVSEQLKSGLITEKEAKDSQMKNIIVRALGASESIEVDVNEFFPLKNDYFLLCSDGLTDLVNDSEILKAINDYDDNNNDIDLDSVCAQLIDLANEKGGDDNITVIIVKIINIGKGKRLIRSALSPFSYLAERARFTKK